MQLKAKLAEKKSFRFSALPTKSELPIELFSAIIQSMNHSMILIMIEMFYDNCFYKFELFFLHSNFNHTMLWCLMQASDMSNIHQVKRSKIRNELTEQLRNRRLKQNNYVISPVWVNAASKASVCFFANTAFHTFFTLFSDANCWQKFITKILNSHKKKQRKPGQPAAVQVAQKVPTTVSEKKFRQGSIFFVRRVFLGLVFFSDLVLHPKFFLP